MRGVHVDPLTAPGPDCWCPGLQPPPPEVTEVGPEGTSATASMSQSLVTGGNKTKG